MSFSLADTAPAYRACPSRRSTRRYTTELCSSERSSAVSSTTRDASSGDHDDSSLSDLIRFSCTAIRPPVLRSCSPMGVDEARDMSDCSGVWAPSPSGGFSAVSVDASEEPGENCVSAPDSPPDVPSTAASSSPRSLASRKKYGSSRGYAPVHAAPAAPAAAASASASASPPPRATSRNSGFGQMSSRRNSSTRGSSRTQPTTVKHVLAPVCTLASLSMLRATSEGAPDVGGCRSVAAFSRAVTSSATARCRRLYSDSLPRCRMTGTRCSAHPDSTSCTTGNLGSSMHVWLSVCTLATSAMGRAPVVPGTSACPPAHRHTWAPTSAVPATFRLTTRFMSPAAASSAKARALAESARMARFTYTSRPPAPPDPGRTLRTISSPNKRDPTTSDTDTAGRTLRSASAMSRRRTSTGRRSSARCGSSAHSTRSGDTHGSPSDTDTFGGSPHTCSCS
mmetsp:Transcript_29534/g.96494  ORF Transcript_29534/g.96494 Transcript_29534/m.96494 type:complete len:452 (+) Transcript_29534:1070-2425(+)